jgi:glutathione S-transferase
VAVTHRDHFSYEDNVMNKLEILGAPGSNFVWVTRIACVEKGVPYTLVPTMPRTPEVSAIHPFGKIPAMRHGDVTLCESRAICHYIDFAFEGPPLVPRNPIEAARVEQWVSMINTHVDQWLVRRYVGAYFFPATLDGSPDRPAIDSYLEPMKTQFAVLDAAVAATGFLAGNAFTLADMDLIPILFYMEKLPESRVMLTNSKHLHAYLKRHLERPSVRQTIPETLPNASPKCLRKSPESGAEPDALHIPDLQPRGRHGASERGRHGSRASGSCECHGRCE